MAGIDIAWDALSVLFVITFLPGSYLALQGRVQMGKARFLGNWFQRMVKSLHLIKVQVQGQAAFVLCLSILFYEMRMIIGPGIVKMKGVTVCGVESSTWHRYALGKHKLLSLLLFP